MLVNHKIQIFWIILFVGVNVLISIGMEGPLATHVTFLMWTVRGKAISEFRSPNALPRAPTPLGTELVLHLRCVTLLTFVCMLRYSMWNVVPRMFLTSHYSDRIVLCQYHLTPTLLPTTQDRTQSRPHPSFTQLTTSRGAGVCPGNSAGGSKLLGLRGSALFSKILLSERSEFRIFGNGFSRFTES